jgi:hypothetical protein
LWVQAFDVPIVASFAASFAIGTADSVSIVPPDSGPNQNASLRLFPLTLQANGMQNKKMFFMEVIHGSTRNGWAGIRSGGICAIPLFFEQNLAIYWKS